MGWFNHQLEKQAKSNEWKISFPTRDQVESPSRRPLDAETAGFLGDGKMEIGLLWDTVDGSEIRLYDKDLHYFYGGFIHPAGGAGFLFYQQYFEVTKFVFC